ncbi:MAG: type II toxin-antitoxin system RelE/ParE family toxin [Gemmatimonadaceae bacterium]|nr:type II toxin-antitoxin system RelE/ParE family toxin [Gemmatimonadaceae bacterium]
MSRALFLRSEAKDELRQAFDWYEERRIGLGFEFLRTVRVVLAAIERAPEHFPVALDDIRKAPLRRFPYVVYFVVLPAGVSVFAIHHARRHPRRWTSRK